MQLNVLYFAHVRERIGRSRETLDLPDGALVRDAVALLTRRYPQLGALMPSLRIALDGEFTTEDAPLRDGGELVLIPPVAGGAGPLPLVALVDHPIDDTVVARLSDAVGSEAYGAVVTFVGVVRNHARGRQVERLEYEAYPAMALKLMRRLRDEVETAVPGARVAVHHRVGSLVVGDAAVAIAAASAHRGAAFEACRMMIDRLKDDVPIWKREIGPDGAEWVSDRP